MNARHPAPAFHTENGLAALSACRECSGVNCCGKLRQGGPVEPPFLTVHDLRQVRHFTGLSCRDFAEARTNPVTGKTVFFMRVRPGGGCVFFSPSSGKCRIYTVRPIDCKLFPLDIKKIGRRYAWILYRYQHCHLTEADRTTLLRLRDQALSVLGHALEEYATVPVPGMDGLRRRIVGWIGDAR